MITIEPYCISHADSLSRMLLNDQELRKAMGARFKGTPADYHKTNTEWAENKNTVFFTILVSEQPAGGICLSHIDKNEQVSQIGYWIASEYWNQGIMTKAFRLVLDKAKELDIHTVKSTIPDDYRASQRLWERYAPVKEKVEGGKTKYVINLAGCFAVRLQDEM